MLRVDSISIRYERKTIIQDFSFSVNEGEIVSIIGPNGSGKSTLLKAIARQTSVSEGKIELEGIDVKSMHPKQTARKLCMLSQRNVAPDDMTVADLVAYGRYPHKKWFEKLGKEDDEIIGWALDRTHLSYYKDRRVASLSGGEAQRAWIAMALAQRPKILLLDEPTTYLDISHQHEVLELVHELNQEMGMTVIMVLHDLNQASHYSDRIVVVREGRKQMCGSPSQVMTTDMVRDVYQMNCEIQCDCKEKKPRIHLLHTARS
ncbi:iron ABC transporter ATP-binding protein [Sporosarcina sp. NCCP-2222]|uniref:ABC transporter ATP-binding protein n=1 Tax=Sporosarcina sp. NCCP-2222 TaxID=2935073 RepID=UPI002083344C|nr:ABC transporter ATP-binding protein [Sporosarcina sp. NCCP-2222]GKV56499.1 iron ABC transporter ATP-binding protein [Sporosarcina sp. NCCP-2222]